MKDNWGPSELSSSTDLGLSCSPGAREYKRAKDTVDLEINEDIDFWSTNEFPLDHPNSDWDVLTPTTSSEESTIILFESKISLEPSVWVTSTSGDNRVYCGIRPETLPTCEKACLGNEDTDRWYEAVERFLTQLRDWKYESITRHSSEHEAIFAAAFETSTSIRRSTETKGVDRDTLIDDVSDKEIAIAREIRRFSQDILKTYYTFPIKLYRGMGYPLQKFAKEILTNPTRSEYLQKGGFSVLSNFTTDQNVALAFSEVILQREVDKSLIMTVPDFITHTVVYFHNADEWRPVTEAEVRLDGESLHHIPRRKIIVGRGNNEGTLPDAVELIPDSITDYEQSGAPLFSNNQHRAIREMVLSFVNYDFNRYGELEIMSLEPPESEAALDRIETWFYIYENEFQPDPNIDNDLQDFELGMIVEQLLLEGGQ